MGPVVSIEAGETLLSSCCLPVEELVAAERENETQVVSRIQAEKRDAHVRHR